MSCESTELTTADAEALDQEERIGATRAISWQWCYSAQALYVALTAVALGGIVLAGVLESNLVHCTATAPLSVDSGAMGAIASYFHQFGIQRLTELDVSYAEGSIRLRGANTILVKEDSPFLTSEPNVSWPLERAPRATIFFADLGWAGLGARPMAPFFPFIHSLWTDCQQGSLAQCTSIKEYLAPGNSATRANRYAFILFRHTRPLMLHGAVAQPFQEHDPGPNFTESEWLELHRPFWGFDFGVMLRENPTMEAVGWNFMFVKGKCSVGGVRNHPICPYEI